MRANSTLASPAGDGTWRLNGHKWFHVGADVRRIFRHGANRRRCAGISCSSCRVSCPTAAATKSASSASRTSSQQVHASSELELDGTVAWLVGEEGRGLQPFLQMGVFTPSGLFARVDGHHASVRGAGGSPCMHRRAFGSRLWTCADANVLRTWRWKWRARWRCRWRLASAYAAATSQCEVELRRVMTGACSTWVCHRGPRGLRAMETLGGNGYVEDAPLCRFYRELPVNSIWEGFGHIMLPGRPACPSAARRQP